jgi:hypothetical protein
VHLPALRLLCNTSLCYVNGSGFHLHLEHLSRKCKEEDGIDNYLTLRIWCIDSCNLAATRDNVRLSFVLFVNRYCWTHYVGLTSASYMEREFRNVVFMVVNNEEPRLWLKTLLEGLTTNKYQCYAGAELRKQERM